MLYKDYMDIFNVSLTKKAKQDLTKVPLHIVKKLQAWITNITHAGLREVRKIRGYHDEPLLGARLGERSIRLSQSYRAFYTLKQDNSIEIVMVQEVNKHD